MLKLFKRITLIIAFSFGSSIFLVLLWRFIDPPLTPLMIERTADAALKGESYEMRKEIVSIHDIDPDLMRAVIASEDARFFDHFGIDWKAVHEAREYNRRHKRKKRGASTISMQTARNVFLWHDRTWVRKGSEVYFTYLIEILWSKERILELYLNSIEWGKGIFGAAAASEKYFKKEPSKLTRREAALMAVVLPNPRRWSPAKPTGYILRRQGTIQARMGAIALPDDLKNKKKKK